MRKINPIAKILALQRRKMQTYIVPKKGKGTYKRKEKHKKEYNELVDKSS
mgnify:CR=1 FL=1